MTENPSAARPILSTTLQLGDRTIVVEATPLAKSRQTRLGIIVDQPRASRLRLKQPIPRVVRWFLAILLIVVTTPIATAWGYFIVFLVEDRSPPMGPFMLFMLVFMGSLVLLSALLVPTILLFGRRPDVDFAGRRVHLKRFGTRASRLKQARILAVQLLPGRVDEDLRSPGPGIQLNLILDAAAHPRVGYITFRDLDWTRAAARTLANYLGVPLVDQLPIDGARRVAAGAF